MAKKKTRGRCLCVFFDIVFLLDSVSYSLWAVVVFPTVVGFPRYILCLNIAFVLCVDFRAYILVSVVAERTSESNPIMNNQTLQKVTKSPYIVTHFGQLPFMLFT